MRCHYIKEDLFSSREDFAFLRYNLPAWKNNHPLSHLECKILAQIVIFMQSTGKCYASNHWLARVLGAHPKSISRSLNKLARDGLVHIKYIGIRRYVAIRYHDLPKAPWERPRVNISKNVNNQADNNLIRGNIHGRIHYKKKIDNKDAENGKIERTKKAQTQSVCLNKKQKEGFEQFWAAYPKHVFKRTALKTYLETNAHVHLRQILYNIKERKRLDRHWGAGYIKKPEDYLRNQEWNTPIPTFGWRKTIPSSYRHTKPSSYAQTFTQTERETLSLMRHCLKSFHDVVHHAFFTTEKAVKNALALWARYKQFVKTHQKLGIELKT